MDARAERLPACRERPPARRHRRRLRLHGPSARRGEELHHHRAEEQFPRHAREGTIRTECRAEHLGRTTQVWSATVFGADDTQARAVPLHPDDPVVTRSTAAAPARAGRARAAAALPRRCSRARVASCRPCSTPCRRRSSRSTLGARRLPLRRARPAGADRAGALAALRHRHRWPAVPRGFDAAPLHALVRRRHAELEAAIEPSALVRSLGVRDRCRSATRRRRARDDGARSLRAAVFPWVAGFADRVRAFRRWLGGRRGRASSRSRCSTGTSTPTTSRTPTSCSPRSSRSSRRPTWPRRSRSWCARCCCSPTSPGVAARRHG